MSSVDLVGPLTLVFLMGVVGLQLTLADFRRVVARPWAVVAGTLGQVALLPLMTWALVSALGLSPVFSAGAVVLAASPGAGLSNVMAAIAGAHVALSVTLTAISSLLAVVTLPALTALGMALFLGDAVEVDVPVGHLVRQLTLFLLLPIALGMALRAQLGDGVRAAVPWINRLAIAGIVLISVLSGSSSEMAPPSGSEIGLAAVGGALWTAAAFGIGWGLAALLDLDADDRFTFGIEFGARNVALAFIVAVSSLGQLELGLFSGVYAFVGFPAVLLVAAVRGRLARQRRARPGEVGLDARGATGRGSAEPGVETASRGPTARG